MPAKSRKSIPKQTKKRIPRASRPDVPAGYRFPTSPEGLLDWNWARERLTDSHNYVIVTVRPDGRPHAMGMHGIWFEDAYYFGPIPPVAKPRTSSTIRIASSSMRSSMRS